MIHLICIKVRLVFKRIRYTYKKQFGDFHEKVPQLHRAIVLSKKTLNLFQGNGRMTADFFKTEEVTVIVVDSAEGKEESKYSGPEVQRIEDSEDSVRNA